MAVPFRVPLVADRVLGPRLVYGTMPTSPAEGAEPIDALLFTLEDDSVGRVTFEGLDAVRAARGEVLPCLRLEVPPAPGEWLGRVEAVALRRRESGRL